jgi:antitoxin (DNA-binding transcriptional repressor) of toxin-antitoxin stability system
MKQLRGRSLGTRLSEAESAQCEKAAGRRGQTMAEWRRQLLLASRDNREAMATIHMSEAEVARDLRSVLAKVRQGVEVIIEQDQRPVAVLKASEALRPGRRLSECLALARAYEAKLGEAAVPDEGFARDVQAGIDARRDSFGPPGWD